MSAPANLRTESGQLLIKLPVGLGGRLVRAFEWIDAVPVSAADPAVKAWAGRTTALIERLGEPTGGLVPDPWSWRAPTEEDWAELAARASAAGRRWSDELRRAIPGLVALAREVGPHRSEELIMTHSDLQPPNVLARPDGRLVLIDWDNPGPSSRRRALGRLVNDWNIRGADVDHQGIEVTLRAYWAAGGTVVINDLGDLGDAICGYLNYLQALAGLSLDPTQPDELVAAGERRVLELLASPAQVGPLQSAVDSARAAAVRYGPG